MNPIFLLLDVPADPPAAANLTRNPWLLIGAGLALLALLGWFIWKKRKTGGHRA